MAHNGWIESSQPLANNRFGFEIEPFKDITPKEFNILEELRTSTHKVEGIGTDTITVYIFDNENIDFYRLLKDCKFRSVSFTQFRPDSTVARKLSFSVKEKATVFLAPFDWLSNKPADIVVIFEVEDFGV